MWRFVEGLDLSAFYATIRSREGRAGRPAIDPKILLALWLYATMDGVGSAREVDRLCYSHDAYRWLRGGVSVNYHTLSDFRVRHTEALNGLLTDSIATLVHRGIVTLARVAQDGTRVRGSAGAGSFRREGTLRECLRAARKQVERTAKQTDAPINARAVAAHARAAAQRPARSTSRRRSAPRKVAERKEVKVAEEGLDADDGALRNGTRCGFCRTTQLERRRRCTRRTVTNLGSDRSSVLPMLTQLRQRTGRLPTAVLVDGGCFTRDTITEAAALGVTVYAPLSTRGGASAAPQPTDSAAVANGAPGWRPPTPARCTRPGGHAEWVHADAPIRRRNSF